jgi:hypothetical protein
MNFHGSFWAGRVHGWCEPRKMDSFTRSYLVNISGDMCVNMNNKQRRFIWEVF